MDSGSSSSRRSRMQPLMPSSLVNHGSRISDRFRWKVNDSRTVIYDETKTHIVRYREYKVRLIFFFFFLVGSLSHHITSHVVSLRFVSP